MATHVIYIASQYQFRADRPIPRHLLLPEYHCLMDALPLGVAVGNADLVGECVDTLHMLGEKASFNSVLRCGVDYLVTAQLHDGSWSSRNGVLEYDTPDPDKHHATFVCMWALLSRPPEDQDKQQEDREQGEQSEEQSQEPARIHVGGPAGVPAGVAVLEGLAREPSYLLAAPYAYPASPHSADCPSSLRATEPQSNHKPSDCTLISFVLC